ncbi:cyclohexadienyl dehydratase [Shewanella psychrophila]|uniref:chorismate mutase n=1 Tax=Shewanella psychrophila TaxID=225848 RepID=A0A1S6HNM0_9GAMM|nr:transporter substrate-binding domain-containing protein [Shewanella psychrophila]AQS37108.1 cyclohexadienyl dehydratase [Shewanella psychrophila]
MAYLRFYTVNFASLYAILCFSLLTIFSFSAYAEEDENLALYSEMNTRLGYMKAVALYKWQNKLAIEDLTREKLVIEKSVSMAKEQGVASQAIEDFFRVQIEIAKKIQRNYYQQWTEHGLPAELQGATNSELSLSEIRPQLIVLGKSIIQGIASHQGEHDFVLFDQAIDTRFVSLEDKALLFRALTSVKPKAYSSVLDRILAQKIMFVGTTGDYEPFSYLEDMHRSGVDIDLANQLAASLGAKAVFIHTSWASLITDFRSQNFDIMMSGISKKLFRQQVGLMSDVYLQGGKTPITLCANVSQYDSLAKIDKPSTRVIVNKGGTNQRFVDDNIKQAKVTVHGSNVTVFQEILDGRADVMITDRIEVQLQSKKHPKLCAAMPDTNLSYSAKAFLMSRDLIWKEYVDAWLEITIKDGTMASVFARYI